MGGWVGRRGVYIVLGGALDFIRERGAGEGSGIAFLGWVDGYKYIKVA
jgi:hypothetical protein